MVAEFKKIGDAFTDEYLCELWERRDPAAYPYVSVISDGEVLVVYPDDETIRAWNRWASARTGHNLRSRGQPMTTASVSAAIRNKESACTTVKGLGRARPTEQIGTCPVRREGNTFFFAIAEQVTVVSR